MHAYSYIIYDTLFMLKVYNVYPDRVFCFAAKVAKSTLPLKLTCIANYGVTVLFENPS